MRLSSGLAICINESVDIGQPPIPAARIRSRMIASSIQISAFMVGLLALVVSIIAAQQGMSRLPLRMFSASQHGRRLR